MDIDSFIHHFESAFETIDPGSLRSETKFRDHEGWDSVTALNLLAVLDVEYGVQIGREEMNSCLTVQQLFELVRSKKK